LKSYGLASIQKVRKKAEIKYDAVVKINETKILAKMRCTLMPTFEKFDFNSSAEIKYDTAVKSKEKDLMTTC